MDDGGRRDDDYRSNRAESTASPLPFFLCPPAFHSRKRFPPPEFHASAFRPRADDEGSDDPIPPLGQSRRVHAQ